MFQILSNFFRWIRQIKNTGEKNHLNREIFLIIQSLHFYSFLMLIREKGRLNS